MLRGENMELQIFKSFLQFEQLVCDESWLFFCVDVPFMNRHKSKQSQQWNGQDGNAIIDARGTVFVAITFEQTHLVCVYFSRAREILFS